ncbi:uncharacterized protein MONOS_34 [Monocercomonoides exilis]|uniref:uncharacterized protein n=1 Tax=Monocercomonoides exilis TaxID=2049356 RepID=UPI00355AB188|nr:hypothetical protein MONOS_34 [Monocercomonoides exilis]|eukprot:MONOS_34.1-p1 / transcript=MONOS_34.1 / gene=MONOS_34 / organism=Monocercomonoides_exilis_PA203 / gene_product=unspecified product / transcript_product=unspecified product / location=Mono_scaffold00001:112661-113482(+) / protein_length=246 / sequence_SO=supercontig / SO=protein_coding / is_pseudo=false
MVQLVRERERAGEVAEERTQLVGVAVEVMWVMLEELRVRGAVREVRWKMLWLLRASWVIAVWLRAREPAVRKKRGVVIELEVVPVMVVVLRLREGEFWERWKRMEVMGFEELWATVRAETVRELSVCRKRADEADGSGEEDVERDDENDENEENDDYEVFVEAKVEMRREREASLKGATHPRAYSTVAQGLCCVLPQASTSLPPFATILFWLMIGSQPLHAVLSAVPAFHTLFAKAVEPHCWNGD